MVSVRRSARPSHRAAITTAILLGACVGANESSSYRLEETASGVPWARNVGGAEVVGPTWTAETTLSIGVADGAPAEVFGSINALASDPHGRVIVLDGQAQEVRIFSPTGQHEVTFGRRGDGPAEFGYAAGLAVAPGGDVWVSDVRRQRLLRFSPDGTYAAAVAIADPLMPLPVATEVAANGDLLGWRFLNPGRDYSIPMHSGPIDTYQPLRVRVESESVDTFPSVIVEVDRVGDVRVPLGGLIAMAPAPDGSVWFSHPTDYVIYHRAAEGDTILVVSLEDATPAPTTPALRDSLAAGLSRTAERFERRTTVPRAEDLPPYHRMIERILVSSDGMVYVLPRVDGHAPGRALDLFEAETGEYRGRIQLPVELTRTAPARGVADGLLAAVAGPLDVPLVVRLRFPPESDE